MKKANLVLRILTMALLLFAFLIGLLAIASSHNVPAKTYWAFGTTILLLLIVFIILQIKSQKK
jgi:hypothetical protein